MCDLCGKKITGNYIAVNYHTMEDGISKKAYNSHYDLHKECFKVIQHVIDNYLGK